MPYCFKNKDAVYQRRSTICYLTLIAVKQKLLLKTFWEGMALIEIFVLIKEI